MNVHESKGSALIAVLVFSLVVMTLLGTAIGLAINSHKLSHRNAMLSSSLYLAEAGAEEALWAINQFRANNQWASDGWELSEDDQYFLKVIQLEDEAFPLNLPGTARIRIMIRNPNLNNPGVLIHSEGIIISSGGGEPISQMITMQANIQSPFKGLIAKDAITFSGQPRFDSYNSNDFPYSYQFGVNSAQNVTAGSISKASGSVNLSNAMIFGNVVSGASDPLSSGAVSSGPGAQVSGSYIGDFDQDFPPVTVPDTTGWATSF
jgi:hypothetical protein